MGRTTGGARAGDAVRHGRQHTRGAAVAMLWRRESSARGWQTRSTGMWAQRDVHEEQGEILCCSPCCAGKQTPRCPLRSVLLPRPLSGATERCRLRLPSRCLGPPDCQSTSRALAALRCALVLSAAACALASGPPSATPGACVWRWHLAWQAQANRNARERERAAVHGCALRVRERVGKGRSPYGEGEVWCASTGRAAWPRGVPLGQIG